MQMESLTVVPTGTLGDCPAAVDRSRGILYVNPRVMGRLTPFQRRFVLLHEEGHWRLGTSSEEEADAYAFDRLAGTEHRSLRQSVESLEEILHEDNPTLPGRYEALLRRALEWDAAHGNPRAAAEPGVAGTRHRPPGGLRRHLHPLPGRRPAGPDLLRGRGPAAAGTRQHRPLPRGRARGGTLPIVKPPPDPPEGGLEDNRKVLTAKPSRSLCVLCALCG